MPLPTENFVDVKRRFITSGGVGFLVAEPPQQQFRQHARIIAAMEVNPDICGQTILYSDTYFLAPEPDVFVYARHKCSPAAFFNELDFFVEELTREMPELRREFNLMFNISGKIVTGSSRFPIHPDEKYLNSVRFFRVDFPFGALTVEFGKTVRELDQVKAVTTGLLSKKVDSPLVGCDLTEGPIFSKLLIRLHWASQYLDPSILENLIAQVTPNSVTA
jgi:hypothetical protein